MEYQGSVGRSCGWPCGFLSSCLHLVSAALVHKVLKSTKYSNCQDEYRTQDAFFSSLSFAQVPSVAEEGEPGGAFCLRCLYLLRQGRRELGYGKRNGCDTGMQLLALETQ